MNRGIRNTFIDDIRSVGLQIGKKPGDIFRRSEYLGKGAKFTYQQIYENGGWNSLSQEAGFRTGEKVEVSDEEYFRRLASAVSSLGRYPTVYERKHWGLSPHKSRFPTLNALIHKAVESGYVPNLRGESLSEDRMPSPSSDDQIFDSRISVPEVTTSKDRPIPAIPVNTKRKRWQRIGIKGFPYAPHDELSLVALFGILCAQDILPFDILELNGGKGIDAICYDHRTNIETRIELKYTLSKSSWNHSLDDLDCLVCWESRWNTFAKPVIELSKLVRQTYKGKS